VGLGHAKYEPRLILAAAPRGRWEPLNKSFEIEEGFSAPRETKNIRPDHCRRIFSLDSLTAPPSPDEESAWAEEERDGGAAGGTEEEAIVQRARRCVWRGNLTQAEVLAVRLWSGPMYLLYNAVLRGWGKGFTTTLHAVHSGIFKLSQVFGNPEIIYTKPETRNPTPETSTRSSPSPTATSSGTRCRRPSGCTGASPTARSLAKT